MKNIKITILIITVFILGASASNIYASQVKMIMIPDHIGKYSTIDLLNYLASIKATEDKTKQTIKIIPVVQPTIINVPTTASPIIVVPENKPTVTNPNSIPNPTNTLNNANA